MTSTRPGVYRGLRQLLDSGFDCAVTDIVGERPGPRVCVIAGMHVNEVSSIEAGFQLEDAFDPVDLTGTVSIISILNTPAWRHRSIGACPIDFKNINFCFPGNDQGTFSERLADDLLNNWAGNAACLVDLHGGDLGEDLMRYSICQLTGDRNFDERALEVARCFDVEVIVALEPSYMDRPGRSVTGLARTRRLGGFAEAGKGGVIAPEDVAMHREGVRRVMILLDMITDDLACADEQRTMQRVVDGYAWLSTPITGWSKMLVAAGQEVTKGEAIATISTLDRTGRAIVEAPESGIVLWCDTHPAVSEGGNIAGIGFSN